MSMVAKMAEAIGYPDPVADNAASYVFRVDGEQVLAREERGRLVLSLDLKATEADLPRLAGYAAGRLVKEEAALAWDPNANSAILWQALPGNAAATQLRLGFEVFMTSCDWWLARMDESPESGGALPSMMIMP